MLRQKAVIVPILAQQEVSSGCVGISPESPGRRANIFRCFRIQGEKRLLYRILMINFRKSGKMVVQVCGERRSDNPLGEFKL